MKIETEEQAKEALVALEAFYREPVMPLSKYCTVLDLWASAIRSRYDRKLLELYPTWPAAEAQLAFHNDAQANRLDPNLAEYESTSEAVSFTFLQIRKSNLLARLFYDKEEMRTEPCPVHKGRWSGCVWSNSPCACQQMDNGKYDSNVCGWLPNRRTQ